MHESLCIVSGGIYHSSWLPWAAHRSAGAGYCSAITAGCQILAGTWRSPGSERSDPSFSGAVAAHRKPALSSLVPCAGLKAIGCAKKKHFLFNFLKK